MSQNIVEELEQYYNNEGIEPVGSSGTLEEMFKKFKCPNKSLCKEICRKQYGDGVGFKFGIPTEIPPISKHYINRRYKDKRIPRIVVVSLSPPMPYDEEDNNGENNGCNYLKQHWRETLALVRSLLKPYLDLEPARYFEKPSAKIIESLFVHLRTSKCCSSANGGNEEPDKVYKNCGPYLKKEISILRPDVVVTQGKNAEWQASENVFCKAEVCEKIEGVSDSCAYITNLKECGRKVYWMCMYHPCGFRWYKQQTGEKIKSEVDVVGAHKEKSVRYGKDIERFMTKTCRWDEKGESKC